MYCSTLHANSRIARALSFVLEKYLRTSLASALAASRRVCCTIKINDGTEDPPPFLIAGKIKYNKQT